MKKRPAKEYPYQNRLLKDLPGEIWKEMPGWEDYEVSNYGRVKSTGRRLELNLGKEGYKKERILSPQVRTVASPYNRDVLNYLCVGVQKDRYRKVFRTARLVYYLFVQQFPLDNVKQIIQYKDGDGLNIHFSNLLLTTNSIKMKKTVRNRRTPRLVQVTQFTLNGKKLKVFATLHEAAAAVQGQPSRIHVVINKWPHYYKGWLWRKGDQIRTPPLKHPLVNLSKPVIRISRDGKRTKKYLSLTQAARHVHATNSNLRKALNGGCRTCKGYQWKWG